MIHSAAPLLCIDAPIYYVWFVPCIAALMYCCSTVDVPIYYVWFVPLLP